MNVVAHSNGRPENILFYPVACLLRRGSMLAYTEGTKVYGARPGVRWTD